MKKARVEMNYGNCAISTWRYKLVSCDDYAVELLPMNLIVINCVDYFHYEFVTDRKLELIMQDRVTFDTRTDRKRWEQREGNEEIK